MKIIYCDCQNGFTGNLFLAALIDAGLPVNVLETQLKKLDFIQPLEIHSERYTDSDARGLSINISGQLDFHLLSKLDQPIRVAPSNIIELLGRSSLSPTIKNTSQVIFEKLTVAQIGVLCLQREELSYSESEANQYLSEIVGAAIGMDYFNCNQIHTSAIPLPGSFTRSSPDSNPLSGFIANDLLTKCKARVTPQSSPRSLITPTGAALLACLATFEKPTLSIDSIGYAIENQNSDVPLSLQMTIGNASPKVEETYVMLETNIDDMPPLALGNLFECLIQAGALDVYFIPIQMKKNRPGMLVNIFAKQTDEARLADLILRETSTFGIRAFPIHKYMAGRSLSTITTEYGEIRVKAKILDNTVVQFWPEYEDCARAARSQGFPFLQVYYTALNAAQKLGLQE
jgi:uncharacterized protein (TIGR00299 family) protein